MMISLQLVFELGMHRQLVVDRRVGGKHLFTLGYLSTGKEKKKRRDHVDCIPNDVLKW